MEKLKIPEKHKIDLQKFVQGLNDIYHEDLLSVLLYGSAASGEFVDQHSDLNLLVVLKNAGLDAIGKSAPLIRKFKMMKVLFMTEEFIASSSHVFPVEFMDMQENYVVLSGRDVLKDLRVDTRNLRFQCEQELKSKLIKIKQAFPVLLNNPAELKATLFLFFTACLHILRNALRLKGRKPSYLKRSLLKELETEFNINIAVWERILAAKYKQVKLNGLELESLFADLVKDLESVAAIVDKL